MSGSFLSVVACSCTIIAVVAVAVAAVEDGKPSCHS